MDKHFINKVKEFLSEALQFFVKAVINQIVKTIFEKLF